MRVRDIMLRDITSVMEDDTVERFIKICEYHGLSALPVVDFNYRLVGYLSESGIIKAAIPDYLSLMENPAFIPDMFQFLKGLKNILNKPVSEFMIKKPYKVYEDDTLLHLADMIIRHKLKVVPVVNRDEKLIGIVRRIRLLSVVAKQEIDENE